MGTIQNQSNYEDNGFRNFNYLPQKLMTEDIDQGVTDYIKNLGISVANERNVNRRVPLVWASQELWAERKQNFAFMENENGEEIGRPFMVIYRKDGIKQGAAPNKYSIPAFNRSQLAGETRKFKFVKVPVFDGTLKGYKTYKIPQPVYIDLEYELVFETHFQQHANTFLERLHIDGFPARQGYATVNGYSIPIVMNDPSESGAVGEISSEQVIQITVPLLVHGKLVDPTKFEEVQTITKVSVTISEKKK